MSQIFTNNNLLVGKYYYIMEIYVVINDVKHPMTAPQNDNDTFKAFIEKSMASCRTLVRNMIFVEQRSEIFHLMNTGLEVVELCILIETDGKSIHVASVHTSICKVAFKLNAISLCTLIPILATCSNKTTHIHDTVLLCTHSHTVSKFEHLTCDFLYRLVLIALLTCLDEICIFCKTSRVENDRFAEFICNGSHLSQVLH